MAIITDRTWASMSDAEVQQAAKLTARESRAVARLIAAVRCLPRGLTVEVDDEGLIVRKQITRGYFHNVGRLKRRTLRDGVKFKDDEL
jgi:hypothetical protein